ncbi:hypothetical protein [Vitiosangium sp. GDMCC 1.1324]|uniref:hypothetical protein n=1 Tax=Vitiosangium sp. (strain GDMCC 1.1324) TaxID=2138576 RepID=UPI000D33E49E|nr:hypothetical protein [Vitiosangium sp. GDMCC 1.1324]PTL84835.1 hypothetical protein DAT35_07195 [Vitiosangium sp. GDMCC 1.1324]
MKPRFLVIMLGLLLAGTLLGTLGTFSLPIGSGISQFWPGIMVQVVGGIWFGGWGVLAGAIFPIFVNLLSGGGAVHVLGFIPANFVQGLIPALAFRHFHMSPRIPGRRGLAFYALWGAAVPSAMGALLGVTALVLSGEADFLRDFPRLASVWALANTFSSLLLGVPTLRVLTPLWEDADLLVRGYWL